MNIRQKLSELLGGATHEQVRAELDLLRIDGVVRGLKDGGYANCDEKTDALLRKFAEFDSEGLDALLKAERPIPLTDTKIVMPSEPDDPIQQIADERSIPYHEAAAEFAGRIG